MARGRTRADEILSVHAARKHQPARPGERHQAALADRAGLPGPQARTRVGSIRGTTVAWVSPSRHAVHRRLRIPALRKGSDSPLRTTRHPSHPRASPSRRLSTPRIPPSDLTVMSRPRSHLSGSQSRAPSQEPCRAVHAANGLHAGSLYDTVRLAPFPYTSIAIPTYPASGRRSMARSSPSPRPDHWCTTRTAGATPSVDERAMAASKIWPPRCLVWVGRSHSPPSVAFLGSAGSRFSVPA